MVVCCHFQNYTQEGRYQLTRKRLQPPLKSRNENIRSFVQRDDIQVGLLIGDNCMKSLEPTRIIHDESGGPYAYKTRLGWCVVGPIDCISKGITTSCNCVAVRDIASSKLASHHFAIEKSVKDVSLEEMFQAMYRDDFNEPELVGASTMLKCGEV